MKFQAAILGAWLAFTACKSSDAPATQGSGSAGTARGSAETGSGSAANAAPAATPFVAKMAELTDKLCACATSDCAAKVNDEMVQWTVNSANAGGTNLGSADDQSKVVALQKRYVECVARLQAADPPQPPPKEEPSPVRTAACEELHKKVSAYASCDKISSEQRTAMFDATRVIESTNDDAKCKAQVATLTADAKKLLACDIASVGVKKGGPPTAKCAALAKRLPGFVACSDLAFGWAEKLRGEASEALDPNDDKACAAVIVTFEEYAKERFPTCKF